MRLCKLGLVLGAVVLLAAPALAQRGGFFVGPSLLMAEKVQKDLDLSKDQVEKVKDKVPQIFMDNRENFQKLFSPDATAEEKAEAQKKINEYNDKLVKDILNEKQQKRFKQIERQQTGIDLFQDSAFVKELKLSDKQKDDVKEINEGLQKELAELRKGGFKPENIAKRMNLRKEAMSNAMKVLNDDQKKQVKEMFGTLLELKSEDFPRPGKPPAKPADF